MNKPAATVYLVTNLVTHNTYVGVTRFSLRKRWKEHEYIARWRPRTRLHHAIAKHGADNFTIEPLASCLSVSAAPEIEQALIARLRPAYNQTNGGEFTSGRRVSPETAAKIAAGNRGKKRTPEQIAANSRQARERWRSKPPEWKATILEALARGRRNVDQVKRIAAVRTARKGVPLSPEARERLIASQKGIPRSKEHIDKIRLKKQKAVICLDTGEEFASELEASAALGISNGNIGRACHGQRHSAGGLRFRFKEVRHFELGRTMHEL